MLPPNFKSLTHARKERDEIAADLLEELKDVSDLDDLDLSTDDPVKLVENICCGNYDDTAELENVLGSSTIMVLRNVIQWIEAEEKKQLKAAHELR